MATPAPRRQPVVTGKLIAALRGALGRHVHGDPRHPDRRLLARRDPGRPLGELVDEIAWVQTAYLVAEIVMIPLTGFFGRALSTRYLFAIAAGGFTLMSMLCATATSIDEMIV